MAATARARRAILESTSCHSEEQCQRRDGKQDIHDQKHTHSLAKNAAQQREKAGIDWRIMRMGGLASVEQIDVPPAAE